MFILAFEANSALSRENETKIVKITHSESAEEEAYVVEAGEVFKHAMDGTTLLRHVFLTTFT